MKLEEKMESIMDVIQIFKIIMIIIRTPVMLIAIHGLTILTMDSLSKYIFYLQVQLLIVHLSQCFVKERHDIVPFPAS